MNPILESLEPSLIRAVYNRKRPDDLDLCLGEPVLPVDLQAFEAAVAWVRDHRCPYGPTTGLLELREAIVHHYRYPFLTAPENVCVTVGSEEAAYIALRAAVDPATDEVLVVEPAYPVYARICLIEGIRCRTVALTADDGFAPRAELVIEALGPDTRLVVLCSPSNPTGRIWPREELERLASALHDRPGPPVQVLFDEVYRELYYSSEAPTSMAALYPHTWVASSLSKSHALTGLRVGWLMAPRAGIAAATRVHHLAVTSSSTFSQRVALELFGKPASFGAHRQHYLTRHAFVKERLLAHRFDHVLGEGAFYCLIRLEGARAGDSVAAAFDLLETARVATVPGRAFGMPCEGWLRASWVAGPEVLREGLERLRNWMSA